MARFNDSESNFIEEDFQWWTNRLRFVYFNNPWSALKISFSLDAIGLAGFSYDFRSLSGDSNPLAVTLEALTNTSENFVSFVMKALLFSFPMILKSEDHFLPKETRAHLTW